MKMTIKEWSLLLDTLTEAVSQADKNYQACNQAWEAAHNLLPEETSYDEYSNHPLYKIKREAWSKLKDLETIKSKLENQEF